jgi:hypothetical protein
MTLHKKSPGCNPGDSNDRDIVQTTCKADNSSRQASLPFGRSVAETSKQAYRDTRPLAKGRKALLQEALREAGDDGLTRAELAETLHLPIQTVCGLVWSMVRAGVLVERGTRPTKSGSSAKIVRLSDREVD